MATGVVLNVRVSEQAHDALAALAKLEHRSVTAMARELIDEALEVRRQQGGGSRRAGGVQTGKEERVESAFEKLVGRSETMPEDQGR
ncbi:MAG: ribbon-helix-helix protein, CopG family [Planctomycetaceae bacterium]|nr:ribbon-helix-helix protein, CopG family [Planctomycetaceae bacterium]